MLPAAPPMACSATIQVGSTMIRPPMSNWNSENIMLLTVLLPATAAPMPPMNGAKMGQAPPASAAIPSARTMGIRSRPAAPPMLLRNTCTIGTVKTSATDACAVTFSEVPHALR